MTADGETFDAGLPHPLWTVIGAGLKLLEKNLADRLPGYLERALVVIASLIQAHEGKAAPHDVLAEIKLIMERQHGGLEANDAANLAELHARFPKLGEIPTPIGHSEDVTKPNRDGDPGDE